MSVLPVWTKSEEESLLILGAGRFIRVALKGDNCEGGNWDLVDLVNLFNSAEIYKNARRIKETNHRGALRPCGAQLKAAPLVSLFLLAFLYVSAELNKLTKSTKSKLPP